MSNSKVTSFEAGHIVIPHFLPKRDQKSCLYTTYFHLLMIKFYRQHLIYQYDFTCSLILLLINDTIEISFKL